MQYREVRTVLLGYVEYIAIMHGLDIKFRRNKRLNEFQYWITIQNNEVINYDLMIMSAEMGDVRNKVVLKFDIAHKFIDDFEDKYRSRNYDFKYGYHLNTLSVFIYDIDQIHKVLTLFEETGFFLR